MNNKDLIKLQDKIQNERAKINEALTLLQEATSNLQILQNEIMLIVAKDL